MLVMRVICDKRVTETRDSLEAMDMDYLLKLNEYLDIQDYLEEVAYDAEEKDMRTR